GAPLGSPELLKTIGPELIEGLLFSVANWPMKGQEEFIERFKKNTGEPFLTQDGLCGYGDVAILAAALEAAGAADKIKVAEALRAMNLTSGPAAQCFPGPIKFDEKGRRVDVPMIFAQWQKGVPITVFPNERARVVHSRARLPGGAGEFDYRFPSRKLEVEFARLAMRCGESPRYLYSSGGTKPPI